MNKANHRAFARLEVPVLNRDPAIIKTEKFKEISADYEKLIKAEGHLVQSDNLDRMHKKWQKALYKALDAMPTSWAGVVALLELCLDESAIGDNADELRGGVRSTLAGVRRLLSTELKAA